MTLRVLITGTSHCAALRAAVTPDPQTGALTHGDMDLRFAAVPNGLFTDMRVHKGVLTATKGPAKRALRHLNGHDAFALAEMDAVVVCGGLLGTHAVTRLYNEARWFSLPSLVADAGVPPAGLALISEGAALAALDGLMQQGPMFSILRNLVANGSCPVLVVQEPRLSQDAIGAGRKYNGFARIAKGRDAGHLSALYDRACDGVSGMRVLLQPSQTRAGAYFTDASYRRGAVRQGPRLDVPQSADDMMHANAAYGGLVLDQIARALTETAA